MPLSFAFLCAFLPAEKKKRSVCGRGGRYERRRVGRKRQECRQDCLNADAAAESFRGGVQPERNSWTRDRLLAYDLYLQEKRKHDLLRQMRQGVDMPYLPQTEYWPRKG